MEADGGELDGQAAPEVDAALHGVEQLRHVGVARVEPGPRVDDAHDGPRQRVLAVPQGLDEGLAQEQREVRVPVRREALAEPDARDR